MFELKELTKNDGREIFEMVKEIGIGSNGFENSLLADTFEAFQKKLIDNDNMSKGIDLDPKYVPQTVYWLYFEGRPVGYGKFRHYLNENLLNGGGNIGYVTRPSERQKGYATVILRELLNKAREKGLDRVLLTCHEDNKASQKVILANGGKQTEIKNGKYFYWITL